MVDRPWTLAIQPSSIVYRLSSMGHGPLPRGTKRKTPTSFLIGVLYKVRRRPTLPGVILVPLARVVLTALFGMGRGGPHRNSHLNAFSSRWPMVNCPWLLLWTIVYGLWTTSTSRLLAGLFWSMADSQSSMACTAMDNRLWTMDSNII